MSRRPRARLRRREEATDGGRTVTRVLTVLAVLLLLPALPAMAQERGDPPQIEYGGDAEHLDGVTWSLNGTPVFEGHARPYYVPAGYEGPLWLHLRTAGGSFTDNVTFLAEGANVTSTTHALHVPSDDVGAVRVNLSNVGFNASDRMIRVGASMETATYNGRQMGFELRLRVVPQVSVGWVNPPRPESSGHEEEGPVVHGFRGMKIAWKEDLPVRVEVRNEGSTASEAFPLVLTAGRFGPRDSGELASVQVPSLDAGERRVLDVATLGRGDVPAMRYSHGRGVQEVEADLQLRRGDILEGDEPAVAQNYTFVDGSSEELLGRTSMGVQWARGMGAEVTSKHLVVGEESWVTVRFRHYGGAETATLRVEGRIRPMPAANYGPGSSVEVTRIVRVAPGASETLNLSFVPTVAAPHNVHLLAPLPDGAFRYSYTLPAPTPLSVNASDGGRFDARMGETVRVPLTLNSSVALQGRLGAVLVPASVDQSDPTPLARFLHQDDLATVEAEPGYVSVPVNGSADVVLEVTPHAAGAFILVPTLEADGVLYTGIQDANLPLHDLTRISRDSVAGRPGGEDGRTSQMGAVGLMVPSDPLPGGLVWAPLGGLVLLVGGVEVGRRRFVR